ncbi:amidinotransferase [Cyanobacteria bacterium FACHB-DQ100]|nr:amidinotransferase [Cyanobacteria bacterium FACHB-DQ100]
MTETTSSQSIKNNSHQQLSACPVNSYNSWDPLEEVIVGRLEGATIPPSHPAVTFNIPKKSARLLKIFGGMPYPRFLIKRAQKQLDEFIHILQAEGVTVRRPDVLNFSATYKTPYWSSRGHCVACPRDGFIVIGNEIIETPMAWRSRFLEGYAYRSLFQEYFAKGARWTAAPKPMLLDDLYDYTYTVPESGEPMRYVINESEPVFDAADFIRCGKDIFVQQSNVTNLAGITWMQRHLGDQYHIHMIETKCRTPMHIDSTFMPLAPGKLLINPNYIDPKTLPSMFKSWDIIIAPPPEPNPGQLSSYVSLTSNWISLNMLMLDEKRVIVEKNQTSMMKTLKEYGFEPIPCPFHEYPAFGGSFHCATLDVRRRGTLQSYF